MKRKLSVLLLCAFAFFAIVGGGQEAVADTGLYGVVTYPGGGVVSSPTVNVYKWNGSSYAYHGSTTASACGYYTYATGSTGNFRVYVSGYHSLRYAPCGSVFDNESVAGENFGTINFWDSWVELNIPAS
jgi:hypothetical protein